MRIRRSLLSRWAQSLYKKLHLKRVLRYVRPYLPSNRKRPWLARAGWIFLALVMASTTMLDILYWRMGQDAYELNGKVQMLLGKPNASFAQSLTLNGGQYVYNQDYRPTPEASVQSATPKFSASFSLDPTKGATITDPVNKVSVTFKPQFGVKQPQQDQNRLVYPLLGRNAQKVYTLKASSMKEDIVLNTFQGKELSFDYKLELADGTEARMEPNGSLAIYGAQPELLGNVATGSEQDEALLKKAREAAEKNNLLFTFPAPFIREYNKSGSDARAWFSLKDNILTLHAAELDKATYPLSVDPSIYIETAAKLMRGNNESNIDFDVDYELIQKGRTTGGRFDSWVGTMSLPTSNARWNHGTAVAGGYIYVTGGNDGTNDQATVYWAKLNTSNFTIESPNPGNGACTDWCTNSAYNLPQTRSAHSMVAYNGFLYVLGGTSSSCSGTPVACSTVYIAKLGANGEPSLWHPTDTNKNNWVYWYTSSNSLSSTRRYSAAAANNNRLYLVGGQTNGNSNGVTTVEYADISPTGDIGSWTTTGMSQLSSGAAARHSHTIQIYNDRMYVIGGTNTGTLQSTVYYIKLANDGTMSGSWTATTAMLNARASAGGNFSVLWGGYIYVSGGCTTINGSGYCTAISGTTQIASINADGTLTDWSSIAATSARTGYGLAVWRNVVYGIGGCTAQNATTGACTTTVRTTEYGEILGDGEASTLRSSVPSGTSPCVTTGWTDCDMPPLGNGNGQGGQLAGGTVVNNGYIYYIGGCFSVGNNSVCYTGNSGKASDTISFSAIAADGRLTRGATCGGTYYGSWCVDNTNTINGSNGLAAFGYTIFNNVIYVIGGTDGTTWQATVWRNPLNADGTLGTWSTQTFTDLDLGAYKGYPYVFARANPSSAGTYPGNLYVIGGCGGATAADNGLNCNGTFYNTVYKCNIMTTGALETADANDCTTSGQVQIDSETGTGGDQGIGVMAGTVYANYIYLIGGQSPATDERGQVMYAKIDNSNNIVDVDGETVSDNIWETSPHLIDPVRRRSVAFGYNGYLYTLAGYNVGLGGSLNDLLFAKIDVSDGSIDEFQQSTVTVTARWDLRAVVNNGYVYTLGGCDVGVPPADCSSTTATIQTFQLYNNYSGSPAAVTTGNNIGVDRTGGSATIMNGYIYYVGGCTNIGCTTMTNTTYYASLDPNGIIGTWSSGGTLPGSKAWGKLVNAGGTLYYLGGQTGSALSTAIGSIYYTTGISSGNPTWGTTTVGIGDTGSGSQARTQFGAAVWNDRIYVTGGYNASSAVQSTVYVSPDLASGGNITSTTWTSSTAFNVARAGHTTIAYANNLYILGGFDGTNYLNDVQYTQINSDASVDSWSFSTSLPSRIRDAEGFAANGYMYLVGGRTAATTCAPHTVATPISANTTIATGNNPTGVGEWYETNVKYTGDRFGAAAVYSEGKTYLLGGGCSSLITSTDRTYYSTLQSQPQIARYSRMIDTDTDVFPTYWLMNGLDNSTGAEWNMRYRSMTDIDGVTADCVTDMTTWGQETNFGKVTLGRPETYTARDGSGTNTTCARYFYLSVTIDSSQAYGYPEDVSRGPTIADLSLFFTSDPSKRLRGGKTYTGGELQPLDTPCRVSGGGAEHVNCPLP